MNKMIKRELKLMVENLWDEHSEIIEGDIHTLADWEGENIISSTNFSFLWDAFIEKLEDEYEVKKKKDA